MHEVVLCADGESLRNPMMLGLEGESLEAQSWLCTLSKATEARAYLQKENGVDEVWVASSDDVDPINLAAALKHDRRELKVRLIAWQGSGSLRSRASSAGIDEVLSYPEFARRYAEAKRIRQRENPRRRGQVQVVRNDAGEEAFPDCEAPGSSASGGFAPARAGSVDRVSTSSEPVSPESAQPMSGRPELVGSASTHSESACPEPAPACPDPVRPAPLDPESPFMEPLETMRAKLPFEDELSVEDVVELEARSVGASGEPERHNGRQTPVRRGYALCVVSASGGTGKSTVSSLAALISAAHGYKTVLIDGDLQFGDAASMFDGDVSISADAVIARPELMDQAQPAYDKPLIISAPERIEQSELYLPQMPGLIDRARESFDVVVVNTGAFWTESHVQIMEACSNTLFLMDQRPTSVTAVKRALDLCARCGIASQPFLFAVNRCGRHALLTSLDISCALGGVAVAELREGGGSVAELSSSGMVSRLLDDHNDLCVSLNDFLGRLIPDALGLVPQSTMPSKKGRGKAKARRKAGKRKGKVA